MSKTLTRLALALVVASLCAWDAAAQTTLEWIVLSPAGEEFTARVPKEPLRLEQDVRAEELVATGQRYTTKGEGGARYVVWSLKETRKAGAGTNFNSRYLDLLAEAAWQLLVEPEFERLALEKARTGQLKQFVPRMPIKRAFDLGGRWAREYTVMLEREGGPVYVCADGASLYIVAALAPDPQAADSRRFVDSFALKTPVARDESAPVPSGLDASAKAAAPQVKTDPVPNIVPNTNRQEAAPPANTGGLGTPVDNDRPFRVAEVTKKAMITFKPEPGFTEWARRFEVTGVVRLRAILSKTGSIMNISVVKGLPHGLTEKALAAARQIRFNPAQIDGQPVSQYVVLEYNFNIY